jgi:dTDP-4-amino-4,6-dideoxygalactose transaminase
MQIPLVDLQAQYRPIKQEIMAAIEGALESMQLFLGPQSQAFEKRICSVLWM